MDIVPTIFIGFAAGILFNKFLQTKVWSSFVYNVILGSIEVIVQISLIATRIQSFKK